MEGGRVCVCELGPFGVHADGEFQPVSGHRNQLVLARLTTAGPAGVTTDALVESVWGDVRQPPTARRSLANIISRLRSKFGTAFIATADNGYRLGRAIESDRSRFVANVDEAAAQVGIDGARALATVDDALLLWRGEPWSGLDVDWADADRGYLNSLHQRATVLRATALTEVGRGLEAITIFERLTGADPLNEAAWSGLAEALRSTGRRAEALRVVTRARGALADQGLLIGPDLADIEQVIHAESAPPPERSTTSDDDWLAAARLETLHACSSLWLQNQPDDAVDALLAGADNFEADVIRRLRRIVTVIPASDTLSRQLWAYGVRDWGSNQDRALRWLISNDARALELTGLAGLETADNEVENASSAADLSRALRVRFMVGLGHPLDERQLQVVKQLGGLDSLDATVEAARFEAIIRVKQGRMAEAVESLHRYAGVVAKAWPGSDDDFAPMALHILGMHPQRDELGITVKPSASYPAYVADDMAARVSLSWHARPPATTDPPRPYGFTQVLETTTSQCAEAMLLRWHVRTGQLSLAEQNASVLREQLDTMPRDRWFQSVPAALGEYAIATGDGDVAQQVAATVTPWAGEVLGLWPMDALIGPANQLLDRLADF